MRIIQTKEDIQNLSNSNIPPFLIDYIEGYFNQLAESLMDGHDTIFSLQKYGYIVILEAGDNLYNLNVVGLDSENNGLLGSQPEYVEVIELAECKVFKIAVMYTNDYLMTFFTIAGSHDCTIENWLSQQAGCTSSPEEILLNNLKTIFERNELSFKMWGASQNTWIMAVSALAITKRTSQELFPHYVDLSECNNNQMPLPTHLVRIVLRSNDSQWGLDEYVDGNTFCFLVDESTETATLLWEDEAFNDSPSFHGGTIPYALRWVNDLAEPFYLQINDPFLLNNYDK